MNFNLLRDKEQISRYVNQFGPIRSRGKEYLKRIVEYYVENDFSVDFSQILKQVGAQQGCDPKTIHKAISRFLYTGWSKGFDWAWRHYLGWTQPEPPQPAAAIQMLCKSYITFVLSFQDILACTSSWYIRLAVERMDALQEG